MARPLTACGTVLAVLAGFVLAPYSHIHAGTGESVAELHHGHLGNGAVAHAHLDSHEHGQGNHPSDRLDVGRPTVSAGHESEARESVVVADEFVAHSAADGLRSPAPVTLVTTIAIVPVAAGSIADDRLQPPAHGPPASRPSAPRAPPTLLPAA